LTEDRFDQLTQRLATVSMSRRGAIGVIGGLLAGAVASCLSGINEPPRRRGGCRSRSTGLSQLLGLPIQSPDPLGQEAAFAEAVLSSGAWY
jgi:hypothetical protein